MTSEWKRGQKLDTQNSRNKDTTKSKYNRNKESKRNEPVKQNNTYSKTNTYRKTNSNLKNKNDNIVINDETFPELISDKTAIKPLGNDYVNICKNIIETEKKEPSLKPGWIEFRRKNNISEFTVDGKKYYPMSIYGKSNEYKTTEEIEREKKEEELRLINILYNLEEKYEKRSQEHYELYGELDGYALAKIEREKYEEYVKQLEEANEENEESDEEEYYYESDLSSEN